MDPEAPAPDSQSGQTKATFSVNLLLRTLFHLANFVLCCYVSLWGVVMCITLDTEKYKEQILKDLKYLAPGFGTNWNYQNNVVLVTKNDNGFLISNPMIIPTS
ncbi:unnamed protein product, partial [Iphiclides podalirius]